MNTGRTVEQWHTRTKTKAIPLLNDLAPEAWCEIHPKDALKLHVNSGDRLTIRSSRGEVSGLLVKITPTIQEGHLFVPFHYGESLINSLTMSDFDPLSFEPNFKQCAVNIYSLATPEGVHEESKKQEVLEHHGNTQESSLSLTILQKEIL